MYVKLLYIISTITPLILIQILKKKYKKDIASIKPKGDNFEYSTIFTSFSQNCKEHLINKIACGSNCAYSHLIKIVKFIRTSKHSISLCMLFLTMTDIHDELIKAKKRGVVVRFITDLQFSQNIAAKTDVLKSKGMLIKVCHEHDNLLHHKFCLKDEHDPIHAEMFTGSLNLTVQGLSSNFENVLFTNNLNLIKSFSDEFETLWCKLPNYL